MRIAEIKVTLSLIVILGLFLTCEKQVFDNPYDTTYTIKPPTEVSATPISENSILLTWKNNDPANVGYKIERKTTNEFAFAGESEIGDSMFIDTGLTYGIKYVYRVIAIAGENQSDLSDEVIITLVIPVPTNVTTSRISDRIIRVEWIDNTIFETGFYVERAINDTSFEQLIQLPSNTTSYLDTVSLLGWYHYRVKAITDLHESDYSNIASGWSGITFSTIFNRSGKGHSVSQTTDGGYIIAGNNGLLKTDSLGNEEWYSAYGSGGEGYSVAETKDSGYIATGGNEYSVFLIKTDADGNLLWNRSLMGEVGFSVQQTIDEGYIICGKIYTDAIWWYDMILIKTDSYGDEIWHQTFGAGLVDEAYSVQQTLDGSYIITGEKDAGGGSEINTKMWLIKTDSNGNLEWEYIETSSSNSRGQSVQHTYDGGYIVVGSHSTSLWLFKAGPNGIEEWNQTYAEQSYAYARGFTVDQTRDGGYIAAGDIKKETAERSLWIVKTGSDGTEQWNRVYEGVGEAFGYSVSQTNDGGYVIAGESDGLVWIIKTDPEGNVY